MGSRGLGYQHSILDIYAINGPKEDLLLFVLYSVVEGSERLLLAVLNGTRLSILCF
jgi:hypothetical protein